LVKIEDDLNAIWVNGIRDAQIPGDDPGLLFGLTIFETLRTYDGVPFRLDAHLERLEASARVMNFSLPDRRDLRAEVLNVCVGNVSLRFTVTAGGKRILQRVPVKPGTACRPMRVAQMTWVNPVSLPGAVKHGCRAAWLLAAQSAEVDEVLLVDPDGQILEANRSNVFAVVDGIVVTPPLDGRQLAGVTRDSLLEAARRAQIPVEERSLAMDSRFQEFYLASTLKELSPVVEMNGLSILGSGPIGLALHQAFRILVAEECGIAK
jgi:branched-subunit amino acid aminotransferase/4-amino-4-deoxychorismate lyase